MSQVENKIGVAKGLNNIKKNLSTKLHTQNIEYNIMFLSKRFMYLTKLQLFTIHFIEVSCSKEHIHSFSQPVRYIYT